MATNTLNRSTTPSVVSFLTTGAIAGAIAGIANSIVFLIGQALGVPFEIATPDMPQLTALNVIPVFLFSFVPGIVAGLLAWLLHRYTSRGNSLFVGIAVVFLLLSFIPDIAMPESVTMSTKAGLILMHIIAGGIITYMISRKTA